MRIGKMHTGATLSSALVTYTKTVQDITTLQKLRNPVEGQATYLALGGRSGVFEWRGGDFTTEVTIDTLQGVYIPSEGDLSGSEGCWVRKLEGYVTPEMFGGLGVGATYDDSPAFLCADAVAFIHGFYIKLTATPKYYYVGDVTITSGIGVVGVNWKRVYAPFSPSDLEGSCAIVFNTSKLKPVRFAGRNKIEGVNFWGDNKVSPSLSDNQEILGMVIDNSGFFNYSKGIGALNTINSSKISKVHCANNAIGLSNLVDSMVTDTVCNVNTKGISQQSGANDTAFVNIKSEWNTEVNWNFYGSVNCTVVGGICDRAGTAGFSIGGGAEVQITNVKTRRNGRNILGDSDCAHYFIEGGSKAIITGMDTKTGYDDGGGGDITPSYSVSLRGSKADTVVIVGGDARGCVTEAYSFFTEPDTIKVINVIGIEDRDNEGAYRRFSGKQGIFNTKLSINPTNSSVTSVQQPVMSNTSCVSRQVEVAVMGTTTEICNVGYIDLLFSKGLGNVSGGISSVKYESVAGLLGTTVSEGLQLTLDNISSDGSSFDLTLTNNTVEGMSVFLNIV